MKRMLMACLLVLFTVPAHAEMSEETMNAKYGGADHMVMVSTYARASVTAVLCNLRGQDWGTKLRGEIERRIKVDATLTDSQRANLWLLIAVAMADAKQEWRKDAASECADIKDDLADADRFLAGY
jgi:hypothetical protein